MAAKITVRNNGSVLLEGDFTLVDAAGNQFDLGGRSSIALCRCGQSENKPFCDGSHKKIEFQSVCPARQLPAPVPKP